VVGQADELTFVGEAEVVPLQRQPDRVHDGPAGDGEHHQRGRGAQQPGQATLAQPPPFSRNVGDIVVIRPLGSGNVPDCESITGNGRPPLDSSASCTWSRSLAAVRCGSTDAGGDSSVEITVETFWYAGVSGRVALSRNSARLTSAIGY